MAFVFRFARVKSIRELEEDLAQQRLALSRIEEKRQEEELNRAKVREYQALENFAQPRDTAALSLELEARNCHDLADRSEAQTEVRDAASAQVVADREHLLLRRQKAKMMQSLHDRHQENYNLEDALAQQKVLDELGSLQHLRQRKTQRNVPS